jgi:hypothetical protein
MPARKYAIERYRCGVWHRIDGDWPTWEGADRHIDRLRAYEVPGPYRIVRLILESAAA